MTWIDTLIIVAVMVIGLFLFYRVLKEPIDIFFGLLRRIFSYIGSSLRGGESVYQEIKYG